MSIKILIADDHLIFLQSMSMLIDSMDGYEVTGLCSNGCDVMDALRENQPDIVLCDQEMPGLTGIQTAKLIWKQFPDIKVLMLTMHVDAVLVQQAIEVGVAGILSKKISKDELAIAMEAVMNGQLYLSKDLELNLENGSMLNLPILTQRESEVLKLLARGYSYKMIAEFCHISYFTANAHVKSIYKKLHVNSATEAVSKAIKIGLVTSYN